MSALIVRHCPRWRLSACSSGNQSDLRERVQHEPARLQPLHLPGLRRGPGEVLELR